MIRFTHTAAVSALLIAASTSWADDMPQLGGKLTEQQVTLFAELALKNINIEFPNNPSNVMASSDDIQSPRHMHPAFFGCFDWHSSVHGHWMLVRLLRRYPDHPIGERIRVCLNGQFTTDKMLAESLYFQAKYNKGFERMYGWAWALRLVTELHDWDDADGQRWRKSLEPLEAILVARTMAYLPLLTHPIRTGVHPDSGFALAQVLDYANAVDNKELIALVTNRSRAFYLTDQHYPFAYEPSGQDFFSSGLNEADLMRRVLPQQQFAAWLRRFMPHDLSDNSQFVEPVEVSDVTDGKLVHLAGLNLSRAWCMQGIAHALPKGDPRAALLLKSAQHHAKIGFGYVFSGHYEGEHWLATFAIYTLTVEVP